MANWFTRSLKKVETEAPEHIFDERLYGRTDAPFWYPKKGQRAAKPNLNSAVTPSVIEAQGEGFFPLAEKNSSEVLAKNGRFNEAGEEAVSEATSGYGGSSPNLPRKSPTVEGTGTSSFRKNSSDISDAQLGGPADVVPPKKGWGSKARLAAAAAALGAGGYGASMLGGGSSGPEASSSTPPGAPPAEKATPVTPEKSAYDKALEIIQAAGNRQVKVEMPDTSKSDAARDAIYQELLGEIGPRKELAKGLLGSGPAQADLSPLMAWADSIAGTNISKGYKAPTGAKDAREQAMELDSGNLNLKSKVKGLELDKLEKTDSRMADYVKAKAKAQEDTFDRQMRAASYLATATKDKHDKDQKDKRSKMLGQDTFYSFSDSFANGFKAKYPSYAEKDDAAIKAAIRNFALDNDITVPEAMSKLVPEFAPGVVP